MKDFRLHPLPDCAVLLLCFALAGCGMGSAPSEASQAIDAIFQRIDQGTWSSAYESGTSSEFRSAVSKEEYEKMGRGFHERLGKLLSKERQSFFVRNMNGILTVEASYEAQFEKGKGTIRSTLKKVDGNWLIVGLWVGSPVFLQSTDVPCANCGKPRPKDAAFCPACGKKIEPAQTMPAGK